MEFNRIVVKFDYVKRWMFNYSADVLKAYEQISETIYFDEINIDK